MVLWDFCGDLGTFKTALAVKYAIENTFQGKNVNANITINSPCKNNPVKKLDVGEFLDLNENLECLTILDELYVWLDSRTSGRKLNRAIAKVILQSRKRGIDIIATEQLRSSIDKRFAYISHMQVFCIGLGKDRYYHFLFMQGMRNLPKKISFDFAVKHVFPYYNTKEIVDIQEKEPEKENRKRNIKKEFERIAEKEGIIK